MLSISRFLSITPLHPNFPKYPAPFSFPVSKYNYFRRVIQKRNPPPMQADKATEGIENEQQETKTRDPPSSILAEYAKSNRSSCKGCAKTINSKALRLGLATKDPQGFEAVRWHHPSCFPLSSHLPSSPERAIKGFSALQSRDQEAVKKLFALHDKSQEKVDDTMEDRKIELQETEASASKKHKADKAAEDIENELHPYEASDSKKRKSCDQEAVKMLSAVHDKPQEKADKATEDIENEQQETKTRDPPSSILAEYAKSNRSSCKGCAKTINSKALRLGLATKDPRGFEAVRWHHPSCFPLSSHLPSSPERAIKGFSALQSRDQEAVKKLFALHDKSQEKVDDTMEDRKIELQETEASASKKHKADKAAEDIENELHPYEASDSKKRKANKTTEDIENELQETKTSDSKRTKLCASEAVDINFSVSDAKSNYKDATLLPKWKAFRTVIFLERDDGLRDSSKIAAFDFDGCLANTDVRRVGAAAWSLMYPSIPDKLQSLYNDGFKLVIFTNESNIERWKNKRQAAVDSKIGRLNNFIAKVKVPIQVFIACGVSKSSGKGKAVIKVDDPFRKPKPGMWQLMKQHFNSSISIDMDQSFYVGDAAGRKSDHGDADIKFAKAIGLKFYVPEEYFGA